MCSVMRHPRLFALLALSGPVSLAACSSTTSHSALHGANAAHRQATASGSKRSATGSGGSSANRSKTATASLPFASPDGYAATAKLKPGPNLQPGSQPSVLPSDVLIADRNNNRVIIVNPQGNIVWQFPQPGDLAPGQTFLAPDDAFFTPNGKDIITTQESRFVISEIDIATRRIVWQYGHPGVPGSAPDYLDNPDDAMMLPNGEVVLADIKNCRLLVLRPPSETPVEQLRQTG